MPQFSPADFEPGQWVRHPGRPDWGAGQVQSVIGGRVTVNFEHAGKVLVNVAVVALDPCEAPPD
ncbi:MAG: DUF3553 domain-containing protein [Rhodospirillales bacterium]|jgi:FKBP-type peptidyl-prolyl cis-trans isomerase 2|nr:DUF3553 domain-containing protein [Rhodospirillales bacterium]